MNDKLKISLIYLGITTLVGTFSYVYLSFVPGVFNVWMVGAFSVPLLAGLLEVLLSKWVNPISPIRTNLFRLAIATMTVQVMLKGVYEIALTNFRGEWIYIAAWLFLLLISVVIKE